VLVVLGAAGCASSVKTLSSDLLGYGVMEAVASLGGVAPVVVGALAG
jgi:hypothetical protein